MFGRRGSAGSVEGEPHPTSTQRSVLDGLVVGADPRGPRRAAAGQSCGLRQGVDNMLVPVVQAIRAPSSVIYTVQSWCSDYIKSGCGGSAPAPRAERFIVMFIMAQEDRDTVCACDVCRRKGGRWRMTFRGARGRRWFTRDRLWWRWGMLFRRKLIRGQVRVQPRPCRPRGWASAFAEGSGNINCFPFGVFQLAFCL